MCIHDSEEFPNGQSIGSPGRSCSPRDDSDCAQLKAKLDSPCYDSTHDPSLSTTTPSQPNMPSVHPCTHMILCVFEREATVQTGCEHFAIVSTYSIYIVHTQVQ